MIKKFITKTVLLILLFIATLIVTMMISSSIVKHREFNNYNTESNTLHLKSEKKYDILFMGISHARNFSRHKNHLRVEKILNSSIINIAQGNGSCGVNEQLFYLEYFYGRENKVSKIIYVLSPPMLFSETLPIASNTFDNEIFDFNFLLSYLKFKSENKQKRIISYMQRKLNLNWLLMQPYTKDSNIVALDSLDRKVVEDGQNLAYSGDGLNLIRFKESTKRVEETVKLANSHGTEVFLLIPPALFGKWRGHDETINFAKHMDEKYKSVTVLDASESMLEPKYYYDSHHLNTEGVCFFTEKYLKELVK